LEQLLHRRHPADAVADPLTLQRLGKEGAALDLPLTLMVDERGLPRALWVGELESSRQIQERLSGSSRRQVRVGRLLTCAGTARQPSLQPGHREGLVGLEVGIWGNMTTSQDSDRTRTPKTKRERGEV
jgi:GTP-binding protein HflX